MISWIVKDIKNFFIVSLGFLLGLSLIFNWHYRSEANYYNEKYNSLKEKKAITDKFNLELKQKNDENMIALNTIAVEYDKKVQEYKNFKPKWDYKEVKSNECKEVEGVIDYINNNGL